MKHYDSAVKISGKCIFILHVDILAIMKDPTGDNF